MRTTLSLDEDEDGRFAAYLEALDNFVDCRNLAQAARDEHSLFDKTGGMDLEMVCVTSHQLARTYEVLQLDSQAKREHKNVVTYGCGLDPTNNATLDAAISGSLDRSALGRKKWFKKSKEFLVRQQEQATEDAEKERRKKMEPVKADIEALAKVQRTGTMQEVVEYIYRVYPISSGEKDESRAAPDSGTKAGLMTAVRDYHPDKISQTEGSKQPQSLSGAPFSAEGWNLVCQEICKVLNYHYETAYKNVPS